MARLQDFPSVTPTSSDKILIVQSQGQGLAPYSIKMDSANPTGTGTLTMTGSGVFSGGLKINGSEDVHGTAITTNETFDFTSSTTFSYTGKSIYCPSTHLYICSVQLQFSNNQPQEIGIIDNSSSALIYQTVFRSSSQAFATFIVPPSKTYYIWAKYAGASSNRMIINTVDITL